MDASSETRGLRPGTRLEGELRPPGSKSIAQRALLLAAVARGRTLLGGLPDGEDVQACLQLVRDLGASVEPLGGGQVAIVGTDGAPGPPGLVHVGESGTLARLATGLLALCGPPGRTVTIAARGTLLERGSPALFRALSGAGAGVRFTGRADGWPAEVTPAPRGEATPILENAGSSQELSGLLLASAALEGPREVRVRGSVPSRPYVGITVEMLRRFGVQVEHVGPAGDETWRVRGALRAPAAPLLVEPDASSAAVALAAGCLSGGTVRVQGVGERSCQGDVRIVEHLGAFGCEAFAEPAGLVARGRPRRGVASLSLADEPDLAPVLAVVAAGAALAGGGTSTLSGLDTLRGKESDRVAVLAGGLERAGFDVRAGAGWLEVGAVRGMPARTLVLDPAGDHRMAFAFALLGLLVAGVQVLDPGCVAKSWPGFWDDLERLGARTSPASDVGR